MLKRLHDKISKERMNGGPNLAAVESKYRREVARILRLRRGLRDEEVTFIFDFLLQLLRYASTGQHDSVCLATHLMRDFYKESNKYYDQVLEDFE